MNHEYKKAEASLLQPREGAGKYWWETFLRGHISEVNKRYNQAKALYLTDPSAAPLDLFSYIREAALCFEIGRYLPAVALASRSVELILERDPRMRGISTSTPQAASTTLCPLNLAAASSLGLPVETLLSVGETLDPRGTIIFAERSRRVTRGDVSGWFRAISEYLPTVEHEALDQLEKAQTFVVAWFNTSPAIHQRDGEDSTRGTP